MATVVKRPSGKWQVASGKWQATVRHDGKSCSKSFTKRADAASWARETELQAERGQWQHKAVPNAQTMTLGEVLELYRDEVSSKRAHGETEGFRLDAMRRTEQAGVRLDKLTTADGVKWRNMRLLQVKPSTVVREMAMMRAAINHALREHGVVLAGGNPICSVRKPRIDNRRERRLQTGEWQRLQDAIDDNRTPLTRPLVTLALETGMRRGELLAMQWKHVDHERCTVLLPRTKNGHDRTVPLTPAAMHAALHHTKHASGVASDILLLPRSQGHAPVWV